VVTATGAGQRIYVVVVALAFEKLVTFVASMLKTPVLENLTDSAFAADVFAVNRTPPGKCLQDFFYSRFALGAGIRLQARPTFRSARL